MVLRTRHVLGIVPPTPFGMIVVVIEKPRPVSHLGDLQSGRLGSDLISGVGIEWIVIASVLIDKPDQYP